MSKKLLLSDDSITIQKVIELILSEKDFEITTTNNGEEALSKLDEFVPDLVLADIEMPKINGYELCKRIRGRESTRNIPVLLLAGAFEPIDESKVKEAGADNFIIKPFESQELLDKIDSLLVSPVLEETFPMKEEFLEEFMKEEGTPGMQPMAMKENVEEEMLEKAEIMEGIEKEEIQALDETVIFENEEDLKKLEEISLDESTDEGLEFDTDILTKEFHKEVNEIPGESGEMEDFDVSLESVLENKGLEETDQKPIEVSATEEVQSYPLPVEMPGREEILSMVEDHIGKKLSHVLGIMDKEMISSLVKDTVKESIKVHVNQNLGGFNSDLIHKTIHEVIASNMKDTLKEVDLKEHVHQIFSSIEMPEVEMPGKGEVFSMVKDHIGEKVSHALGSIDYEDAFTIFKDTIKESIKDHMSQNLSGMSKEEAITFYKDALKESIKEQIHQHLREINNDLLNKSLNDALIVRINELTKGINMEESIHPLIFSTFKGVFENLTEELLRMAKETTEKNIRSIFEEKIPPLKTEVENIIWEVLPDIAERLIKKEIEEIKASAE